MATAGTKKTAVISELASCISTIPPTSMEAERKLSSSGRFLTKQRCLRLLDKSLDIQGENPCQVLLVLPELMSVRIAPREAALVSIKESYLYTLYAVYGQLL